MGNDKKNRLIRLFDSSFRSGRHCVATPGNAGTQVIHLVVIFNCVIVLTSIIFNNSVALLSMFAMLLNCTRFYLSFSFLFGFLILFIIKVALARQQRKILYIQKHNHDKRKLLVVRRMALPELVCNVEQPSMFVMSLPSALGSNHYHHFKYCFHSCLYRTAATCPANGI